MSDYISSFMVPYNKGIFFRVYDVIQSALPEAHIENIGDGDVDVEVEAGPSIPLKLAGEEIIDEELVSNGLVAGVGPFAGNVKYTPIKRGTVSLSMGKDGGGSFTATEDGLGNLVGADVSVGTINYETGSISVTWGDLAAASAVLKCSCEVGDAFAGKDVVAEVVDTNGGAASAGPFAGTAVEKPIVPHGLLLTMPKDGGGTLVCYDDGKGLLAGPDVSSGTVDYITGDISITWGSNAAASQDLTGKYKAKAMSLVNIKPGSIVKVGVPKVGAGKSANLNTWNRITLKNNTGKGYAKVILLGHGKSEFDTTR